MWEACGLHQEHSPKAEWGLNVEDASSLTPRPTQSSGPGQKRLQVPDEGQYALGSSSSHCLPAFMTSGPKRLDILEQFIKGHCQQT